MASQFWGNVIDQVATKLNLPEIGLSERIAGGSNNTPVATSNTGRKNLYGTDFTPMAENGLGFGPVQYYGPEQLASVPGTGTSGPVQTRTSALPVGAPGAGGGSSRPDRSNSINANLAALEGAGVQRSRGLSAINDTLARIFWGYDSEAAGNERNYEESSVTNRNNLLRSTQAALASAAEGRRGLFSVLASLGALNGSGVTLANQAVQRGANADITGGTDTFNDNQALLDTSIDQFRSADRLRREDTERAAAAERDALEYNNLKNKQNIYSSLADDYSQMGNAAQAKVYSDMVAALFPDIGRLSVATPGLSALNASYSPSQLAKFAAGGPSTTVRTTPATGSDQLPGLVAQPTVRRRDDE